MGKGQFEGRGDRHTASFLLFRVLSPIDDVLTDDVTRLEPNHLSDSSSGVVANLNDESVGLLQHLEQAAQLFILKHSGLTIAIDLGHGRWAGWG